MAWPGYMSYAGNEFINVARSAIYVANAGHGWLRDTFESDQLPLVLGDAPYRSPLQDNDVPWADPDRPDTYNFYGLWPLNISGLEDSTRTSVITENYGDGGNTGFLRHGTRQITFSVALMGADEAATEAGFSWLKSVLLGGCDPTSPDLCYFAAEPPYDYESPEDCGDDYLRTILQVTVNSGPTITQKNILKDGSAIWQVQFVAVANIPWEFGQEVPIVTGLLDPAVTNPNVAGGDFDDAGQVVLEVSCPAPVYTPVFDPSCPDLVLPPVLPPVSFGCFVPPKNWRRFSFVVPADTVPLWTDVVPLIRVHTRTAHLTNMRVRLWANPTGDLDPIVEPCGFCADFWITYTPESSSLSIDGRDESIRVYDHGQSRRADGLVYDGNHMPFTWPSLTCGVEYLVTLDFQQTQVLPVVDFSLVPRTR